MLQIFRLSPLGDNLSHSIKAPQSAEWKIIYYLKRVGHATKDQVATNCGLSSGEASAAISNLRAKKVVVEETGVEV